MVKFKMPTSLTLYKYGAILIALTALCWGSYYKGKMDCNIKHEQAQTEMWKGVVGTVTKEVQVRVPVVQKIEVESAQQRARIADLSRKLQDATSKRPENPSCDLSDDEFDLMQRAAAETRAP